ncbi:MAG: LysM peptidoglycan-binding domain-containing protein [Polyangiaceae bacterium]|nr:LysM peptidoglycan-binding domain-containing protein [Polyangiaceae bacterium]
MSSHRFGFGSLSARRAREAELFYQELVGAGRPGRLVRGLEGEEPQPTGLDEETGIPGQIAAFLRSHASADIFDQAHGANLSHPLVMYGETHVGDGQKSYFFAELIRRASAVSGETRPRFHASERFDNTPSEQVALQNYLYGSGSRALTGKLANFREMLAAAAAVRRPRFAVLAANDPSAADDARHLGIFNAFMASRAEHNRLHADNRLDDRSHGHFLIGGAHGARLNVDGSPAMTTTQLFLAHYPRLMVVRLYVDMARLTRGNAFAAGEIDEVFEMSSSTPIHLLPIFRRHNNGQSFFATVRGRASVFSRLRTSTATSHPYDQVFDAILYLNQTERYTVVRGDTLWDIARRRLGEGRRWREIYRSNRRVVGSDPNRIFPGQVLVVPLPERRRWITLEGGPILIQSPSECGPVPRGRVR